LLTKDCIQIANVVPSWQEAIRLAATPLVRQNKIEQRYIEAMIQSIEQYGPYVVITPKVALPHARPSDVFLIFVLAAMDNTSHLQALADLTLVLQHPDQVDSLIACQHEEDISEKIKQFTTKESAG